MCNHKFIPIYYEEKEINPVTKVPTGRHRQAVDYFICEYCGKTEITDGEYGNSEWYRKDC